MKKLLLLLSFICLPCMAYDCNSIPEQNMPLYIEYVVECQATPKLQQYDFEGALNKLGPIWRNYGEIANDKYSYTTKANYIKEKTYIHWLYAMMGSQLYDHDGIEYVYGQMTTQTQEQTMDKLYKDFPKVGHLLQREYVASFMALGEKCMKEGKFPTQMERDVYICHCLYLLKAVTDRQAYLKLSCHIKNVSKALIKKESLYPLPTVMKFVKEQVNYKEQKL